MILSSFFPARLLAACLISSCLTVPMFASASDDIGTSDATFAEAIQAVKDRDFRHAIRLFRLQADQNQHDAQYNLALLLEAGKGAPQNFSDALVWAWSAKLGGIEAAGDLAEDLLDMLPEKAVEDVREKVKQRLEDRIEAGNAPADGLRTESKPGTPLPPFSLRSIILKCLKNPTSKWPISGTLYPPLWDCPDRLRHAMMHAAMSMMKK